MHPLLIIALGVVGIIYLLLLAYHLPRSIRLDRQGTRTVATLMETREVVEEQFYDDGHPTNSYKHFAHIKYTAMDGSEVRKEIKIPAKYHKESGTRRVPIVYNDELGTMLDRWDYIYSLPLETTGLALLITIVPAMFFTILYSL